MIYVLTSLFYWLVLYAPLPQALQALITIVDLAPRWLVFLPGCLLLFGSIGPKKAAVYALLTVANIAWVMDVKLNVTGTPANPATVIKIGSYNTGGGEIPPLEIIRWYQHQQLDVLLLQEARYQELEKALPESLALDCYGQLCLLTQHPFTRLLQLDRKLLTGYGRYAASYNIDIRGQHLPLVNVHLNTPRHGLQTQKAPFTNYGQFLRLHANRELESMFASQLVDEHKAVAVIGGDFNLTEQSTIYRRYWNDWQNGFGQAGTGVGYTKQTRFFGARIDHLLFGDRLVVHLSEVHPSMGGDHSPIIAHFSVNWRR